MDRYIGEVMKTKEFFSGSLEHFIKFTFSFFNQSTSTLTSSQKNIKHF